MDNFYITLVSNAESRYIDNTTSSFRTDISNEIQTQNDYYVALTEVIYLHSWKIDAGILHYSIKNDDITLLLEIFDGESISEFFSRINKSLFDSVLRKIYDQRFIEYVKQLNLPNTDEQIKNFDGILPKNGYDTFKEESVIANIIASESEIKLIPKFYLYENNLYIKIENDASIKFEGRIKELLKTTKSIFKSDLPRRLERINDDGIFSSQKPLQITQKLYIYTDIIDYQYVASIKSPLLRTIVIDYNTDYKIKTSHFDTPYYLKVNKTNISTILIEIKDEKGNPIHFENSSVELKLHFKKIK
jgi:hypothetical protein